MRRRVLAVMEAGDAYPSGFIRVLIYREALARAHYDVRYTSRLHPGLRKQLEAPSPSLRALLRSPLGRLVYALEHVLAWFGERRIVRMAQDSDTVYMSKITSLRLVQRLRATTKARLILDFGDAMWLSHRRVDRFDDILAAVDAVTTDNDLTAAHARQRQPHTTVIPDSPQVEWFDRRRDVAARRDPARVVIGWVGTPGTTYNLWIVWEALERVFGRHGNLELRLLGADATRLPPFERVRWSNRPRYTQTEMIDEVLRMDIGLFPLQDVEACRVRGVLKATVYMSGEVAVVASPVGQTPDVVEEGVTGLLASTTDEWTAELERLIADPALRARLGRDGLALVRRRFSVERAFETLRGVLDGESEETRAT